MSILKSKWMTTVITYMLARRSLILSLVYLAIGILLVNTAFLITEYDHPIYRLIGIFLVELIVLLVLLCSNKTSDAKPWFEARVSLVLTGLHGWRAALFRTIIVLELLYVLAAFIMPLNIFGVIVMYCFAFELSFLAAGYLKITWLK